MLVWSLAECRSLCAQSQGRDGLGLRDLRAVSQVTAHRTANLSLVVEGGRHVGLVHGRDVVRVLQRVNTPPHIACRQTQNAGLLMNSVELRLMVPSSECSCDAAAANSASASMPGPVTRSCCFLRLARTMKMTTGISTSTTSTLPTVAPTTAPDTVEADGSDTRQDVSALEPALIVNGVVVGHSWHAVAERTDEYDPAAQATHVPLVVASDHVPAGHAKHAVDCTPV